MRYILFIILLISVNGYSQCKTFMIGVKGDTLNCVDMKGKDGTMYDIDFLMAVQADKLTVTETAVHKINGKPLYNWKQEKGVWKKVKV